MALLTALSTDICAAEQLSELGPAVVIIDKYCDDGSFTTQWFEVRDQRDDLTLAISSQYTDITTQASAIAKKVEQGKNVQLNMSLGNKAADPDTLAIIFDGVVETDAVSLVTKSVKFTDSPGKVPSYYQVAVIPFLGDELDLSYGFVLYYAMAMANETNFIFSPQTPRNTQFSFFGEVHPTLKSRGIYYRTTDGTPVPQLVTIAAEYTAANA